MAHTLSQIMTKQQSLTRWMPEDVRDAHARTRTCRPTITTAVADGVGHKYVLDRFKATDQILSVKWSSDLDCAGLDDCDLGPYAVGQWSATEPAAVDADALVDGADLSTAPVQAAAAFAEILGYGIATVSKDKVTKPLWEAAGVASEPTPGTEYDLVLTSNGNPAAVSNLIFQITYVAGD